MQVAKGSTASITATPACSGNTDAALDTMRMISVFRLRAKAIKPAQGASSEAQS